MKERSPAPRPDGKPQTSIEILDPRHTYTAYIFNSAEQQQPDIAAVIEQSLQLGYPVRYWWLSDAMRLDTNDPDTLIVCTHQPRGDENAGMDLYEALKEKGIGWDDLELAHISEYAAFGRPTQDSHSIRKPTGDILFPPPPDANKL